MTQATQTQDRIEMTRSKIETVTERMERARERVASLEIEERRLRLRLRTLEQTSERAAKTYSRDRTITPQRQAGRHVDAARQALVREGRPLSQKEIGTLAEIGTGTLTHAMQALVSDGLAEATGEKVGRSVVYRLTPKGKRGVTRRPPGS